jgi:hypothetical protein
MMGNRYFYNFSSQFSECRSEDCFKVIEGSCDTIFFDDRDAIITAIVVLFFKEKRLDAPAYFVPFGSFADAFRRYDEDPTVLLSLGAYQNINGRSFKNAFATFQDRFDLNWFKPRQCARYASHKNYRLLRANGKAFSAFSAATIDNRTTIVSCHT